MRSLCFLVLAFCPVYAGTVSSVVVEGNRRVETPTVLSYVDLDKGQNFDLEKEDEILKTLFATGLFSDVVVRENKGVVTIKVAENKVINQVAFEGNERIKDDMFEKEVNLIPRQVYTPNKVQEAAEKIRLLYRISGRYGAKVEPKIIERPENRVDIVFEIDEGNPTRIEKINFIGNERFTDSTLRDVFMTKEYRWYRVFSADDTYDPDRMLYDKELLRKYYLEHGYVDFRVSSLVAELDPETQYFFVNITMEEGERYKFGQIHLNVGDIEGLNASDLLDDKDFDEGDWYSSRDVEKFMERLTKKLQRLGYHFVQVEPEIKRNPTDATVDVTFKLVEGKHIYVNRINVLGNDRTDEDVIRREIDLAEGDAYNKVLINKAERQLKGTDYFRKVDIKQTKTAAPDKVDLDVNVEDKPTGAMKFAAGYSTRDGALGVISLSERNLMGRGYDVGVSAYVSQQSMNFQTGITDPYFMGKKVAVGVNAFHTMQKYDLQKSFSDEFTQHRTGGVVHASYHLTEPLTQTWGYGINRDDIRSIRGSVSQVIKNQAGERLYSGVSHKLFYDKRDNPLDPTEGYFLSMANEFAGVGGDVEFLKNVFSAGHYFPIDDNHRWVFSIKGSGGFISTTGQPVRVVDRFMLGDDSMRGFNESGIGPRDRRTGDALGGLYYYKATFNLTVPMPVPSDYGIKGAIFTDVGSVWGNRDRNVLDSVTGRNVRVIGNTAKPRVGVGVGVNWKSPVGLIGVSFSEAVKKQKGIDRTKTFLINFGTDF